MPNFTATPSTITRLGIITQLASIAPFQEFNGGNVDIRTTINYKYKVFHEDPDPESDPVDPHLPHEQVPRINCFGIGINGSSEGVPYIPQTTDGDLYHPIPFRVIREDHDLNDEDNDGNPFDRSPYRMREVREINGTPYALYWLKRLNWDAVNTDDVRFADVTQGQAPTAIDDPYLNIRGDNMTPTPNTDTTPTSQVIAFLTGLLEVHHDEVAEAFEILATELSLPDTNMQISEIGIYTGVEKEIDLTADGTRQYWESIYTQLAFHRCSVGFPLGNPGSKYKEEVNLENGNLSLL